MDRRKFLQAAGAAVAVTALAGCQTADKEKPENQPQDAPHDAPSVPGKIQNTLLPGESLSEGYNADIVYSVFRQMNRASSTYDAQEMRGIEEFSGKVALTSKLMTEKKKAVDSVSYNAMGVTLEMLKEYPDVTSDTDNKIKVASAQSSIAALQSYMKEVVVAQGSYADRVNSGGEDRISL